MTELKMKGRWRGGSWEADVFLTITINGEDVRVVIDDIVDLQGEEASGLSDQWSQDLEDDLRGLMDNWGLQEVGR